ncbi:MAG TPA: response regulator, partial [Thermoanaerobaculia bacterium]|nr:response regulator [Thermoanaerobaculia bacterium]
VELPVIESAPLAVSRGSRKRVSVTPVVEADLPSLSGIRILVIDDQEYTRDLLGAIFRHAHAAVAAASSVREGLEQFASTSPRIVVCDLAMPEEDGFAFVRAIRALPGASKTTPVIALTAFGRPEDRKQALAAGFDAYLKKPVDPEELTSTVLRLTAK